MAIGTSIKFLIRLDIITFETALYCVPKYFGFFTKKSCPFETALFV